MTADTKLGWAYAALFWGFTAVVGLGPGIAIGYLIWAK